MHRGDRTGSLGMGPLTGRWLGFCADSKVPGYLNASYRREFWFGRRGYRRAFWLAGMIPWCFYLAYHLLILAKLKVRAFKERG